MTDINEKSSFDEGQDADIENNDMELDGAIRDAWSNVKAGDVLKSSTMDAIRKSAVAAENVREQAPDKSPDTVVSAKRKRKQKNSRRALIIKLAAAIVLLVVLAAGGNMLYRTETAYANISASQTVVLGINRFGMVVSVDAPDGVEMSGLVWMSYEDAMKTLIASDVLGGTDVDVEVVCGDNSQSETLVNTSTTCLSDAGCSGTCNGKQYGKSGNAESEDVGESGAGNGNGGNCDDSESCDGDGNQWGKSDN